jgi:hypothetical protein
MARKSSGGAKRTKSGGVSAKARTAHGGGKGLKRGSFPVFDAKSARSALRLRGHAKGSGRATVLNKVSRFASKTNNAALKASVKRARAADKKR